MSDSPLDHEVLITFPDDDLAAALTKEAQGKLHALTRLPDFLIPTSSGIVISSFLGWAGVWRDCDCPAVVRKETYSRGNNDPPQMAAQHATTGTTYQQHTATLEVTYSVRPLCYCPDAWCDGIMILSVELKIKGLTGFASAPASYMMVPGPDPSVPTSSPTGAAPPGPDAEVQIDVIDIPQPRPGNEFTQPAGTTDWVANAKAYLFCAPGTYSRRFHVVPKATAGTRSVTPGTPGHELVFFIDVNATVSDPLGGCQLRVSLETFLMEFRLGYDFTHGGTAPGADNELPEVKPTMPDGSSGGDTHNIAKLVAVDGTALDTPFPPGP